jgi:hypothetical protein
MGANLNHGASSDEICNFLPPLAVLLETLKKEPVLFTTPPPCRLAHAFAQWLTVIVVVVVISGRSEPPG